MSLFVLRPTRGGKPWTSHLAAIARSESSTTSTPSSADTTDVESAALRVLGVPPDASWDDITRAHARLVADLTPGPGASHRNVALATRLLQEVEQAFSSLQVRAATG